MKKTNNFMGLIGTEHSEEPKCSLVDLYCGSDHSPERLRFSSIEEGQAEFERLSRSLKAGEAVVLYKVVMAYGAPAEEMLGQHEVPEWEDDTLSREDNLKLFVERQRDLISWGLCEVPYNGDEIKVPDRFKLPGDDEIQLVFLGGDIDDPYPDMDGLVLCHIVAGEVVFAEFIEFDEDIKGGDLIPEDDEDWN